MIQQRFGRYEIRGELGHGGMATVYHAVDPSFGREVAIKVLPLQMQHHPQFRERFLREGRAIAALEHPHIVPVYDVGEQDGVPFLVMRYMSGGTLNERIPEGGMALKTASNIVTRLAAALDEVHRRGIVHRDLKPNNILFDQYGEAYISDFGIVKLVEDSMQFTGSGVIGTPTYMSPEQASGTETLDGRSDVYSLAVVLYQMLTDRLPYEAETPMGVAMKHLTEPIPDILAARPDLPEGMRLIMQKALAKEPAHRYQTAGELAGSLSALAAGAPEAAHPADELLTAPMTLPATPRSTATKPSGPERTEQTRLRIKPVYLAGAAALGVLILIGGVLMAGRWSSTESNEPATEQPASSDAALQVDHDLSGAEALALDLSMGAAEVLVEAASDGETAVQAEFSASDEVKVPTVTFAEQGRITRLNVTQEEEALFVLGEDPMGRFTLRLPQDLPLDLSMKTGVGDAVIDLRGLDVRSLILREGGPATLYLPEQSQLSITLQSTYGEITVEAPQNTEGLTVRSFDLVDTFGLVRMQLPAAGTYTVNVRSYGEVQFEIPADLNVTVTVPAELVAVDVQDPRITETDDRVWATDGPQGGSDRVQIDVASSSGTIRLMPSGD